jgi:hypothetical protein
LNGVYTDVVSNAEIVQTIKIRAEKPTLGQAHLFFCQRSIPTLEKIKELALSHRHTNRKSTLFTQFFEID